jgi:signal transduction histidine kinase
MIQGVLDGASLATGELRLEIGPHDFGGLVEDVVEVLTPIASDRDVRIEIRIPELPPQSFDRERLLQTLYNLTGNAVKFTPAGGLVVIDAALGDHGLEVSVSDTGTGIAPEALPRIFDRYFTTAKGHEGTGLGLYIAKGVIAAHGGRIWVDSTLGLGSSFHFTLPRVSVAVGS